MTAPRTLTEGKAKLTAAYLQRLEAHRIGVHGLEDIQYEPLPWRTDPGGERFILCDSAPERKVLADLAEWREYEREASEWEKAQDNQTGRYLKHRHG